MFLKNLSEKIKISEARRYILEKTKNHVGRYTKSHVLQYCTKKNTWKKHKIIKKRKFAESLLIKQESP